MLRTLQAKFYGIRYRPDAYGDFETADRSKVIWRVNGHWKAYGSDYGRNACRIGSFRRLRDAVRYATEPKRIGS